MSAFNFEFVCKDEDGKQHTYKGQKHFVVDGFELMSRWKAMVLQPLASAFNISVKDLDVGKMLKGSGSVEGRITAGVDGAAVGEAISRVLTSPNVFELCRSTLNLCQRDGQAIVNEAQFELAYRGNYDELLAAAFLAAKANGFFGRLGGLIDGLPKILEAVQKSVDSSGSTESDSEQ